MSLGAVGVLGSVEAWSDSGVRLELGPSRHRALLAMLAMKANAPVTADTLVDNLWSEDPPPTARTLVHTYVSRLRRALDPDVSRWDRNGAIGSSSAGYLLTMVPETLDAHRFRNQVDQAEALRDQGRIEPARDLFERALGVWRGQAFAGLSSPLLEAERRRLEERRLGAQRDRFALELELGRHDSSVAELSRLAAAHPGDELVLELLMLALYRGGRQSEAMDAYNTLRVSLADQFGVEPGAALRDLYVKILRADPTLHVLGPRSSTVITSAEPTNQPTSTWVVPAQLPRDLAVYTGREDIVEKLLRPLSGSSGFMPVCAIAGRPGVGKTALAIHLAHKVRPHYPDGQVFINLGGVRTAPSLPGEALDMIVRSIDPHVTALPDSVAERTALLGSLTAERRMLIVLDDARSVEQVEALLPAGVGCSAIVTSRAPLVGLATATATAVRLDSLSVSDSLRILRQAAGDERIDEDPAAAAAIVEVCSGLPLAIQIVASKIIARPHWSLCRLAEVLVDERSRLDGLALPDRAVRGSIMMTVSQLEPAERDAFLILSVADLQVLDLGAAAALLGVDKANAAALVETLVDGQLLDAQGHGPTGDLTVSFHDLIRLFAREMAVKSLSPEHRRDAIERLANRYLGLLDVADSQLPMTTDSFVTERAAETYDADLADWIGQHPAEWLDSEAPRMVGLVRQAAAVGLNRLPWLMLDKLLAYTLLRDRWDVWRAVDELALACARRVNDDQGVAAMLRAMGRVELDVTDGRSGKESLETALALFKATGDIRGQARSLKELSLSYFQLGNFNAAMSYADEAILLARSVLDINCLADSLAHRTMSTWQAGDVATALAIGAEAKSYYVGLGKTREIASLNLAFAKCYQASGDLVAARAALQESLDIVERIDDRRGQACVLRDLGMLDLDHASHDRLGYLSRSLILCKQLRVDRIHGQVLYGLGRHYEQRGDVAIANGYYARAWELIRAYPGAVWYEEIRVAAAPALAISATPTDSGGEPADRAKVSRSSVPRPGRDHPIGPRRGTPAN